jgi:hypothetical protein
MITLGGGDMKLFKIFQRVNMEYDVYDSAVVCAENEEEARNINPNKDGWGDKYTCWAQTPEQVEVEYIGEAREGLKKGIIIASFMAG